VPLDSRLQLFDISGRLVKNFSEMPGVMDINGLAPGVIIYKLVSNTNQLLETGKIIIVD
jgi:hypothetical protein